MENAALLKLGLTGVGLYLLSGKKKTDVDPSEAQVVIDALPEDKQEPAEDYVKVIVWHQKLTNVAQTQNSGPAGVPTFSQLAYGTPQGIPGWRTFQTKDDLINYVLGWPSNDAIWNSTDLIPGQLETNRQLIIKLLGRPLDTSTLTRVDKYNLLNSLSWPHTEGEVPVIPPSPPMLSAKGNAKMNFLRFISEFINNQAHEGSDMIYVRTAEQFKWTGQHHTINTGCDGATASMGFAGGVIYRGTYTAMRDYIIFASYGGCANQYPDYRTLLTEYERDDIIRNFLADAGGEVFDSIGPNGPNSTYIGSLINAYGDFLEALVKAFKYIQEIIKQSNDKAAEDADVADMAGIDPTQDYSTEGG